MNRPIWARNILAIVAAATVIVACGPNDPSGLVGKPAPEIKVLAVLPKGDVTLSNLKGKVVVLDFWATYCGPCRMLSPELERMQNKYRKDGLVILGISPEARDTVSAFQQQNTGLAYDLYLDDSGMATHLYKADEIPTTVVIGKDGTVSYYNRGFSELEVVELEKRITEELAKA